MDPKDRDDLCSTGPDEVTMAREKKRSRRVSFAEITSVHVFDRDEYYETPPDSRPSSENLELGQSNESQGFHRDLGDSDDSKELSQNEDDAEEEYDDERELFVQDMDYSSPGSAIGSAISNDEDNFFGPVSASFIRSGCLSDSAASDDNHDITLDSTAFSLHFRSLMQSDSGGNFRTPTGAHCTFEEKTQTENSMPTNPGSFMVLTGFKKPIPRCSVSGGKSSGASDSNDMSLIEANPHRYDYGRLSPTLDALLAEGSKDIHAVSISEEIDISKSSIHLNKDSRFPRLDEHKSELNELKDSGFKELGSIVSQDTPTEVVSHKKLFEANGGLATTPFDQINYDRSSSAKNTLPDASIGHHIQALNESTQVMPFGMDMESSSDALEASGMKLVLGNGNSDTLVPMNNMLQMDLITQHDCGYQGHVEDSMRVESPKGGRYTPDIDHSTNQNYGFPLEGSVSSLLAKRRQIFLDASVSSRSEWIATPSRKQPCSFLNKENIRHDESVSSIKKTISKFNVLGISPFGAMLEVEDDNSKSALSDHFCKPPSFATNLDENNEDPKSKQVDVSVTGSEEHLLSVAQKISKQSTVEMDSYGVETLKSTRISEEGVATVLDGECRDQISSGMLCNDQPSKLTAAVVPPFQLSGSGNDMQQHPLTSHNPIEGALVTPEPDSSPIEITFECKENKQVTSTPDKFTHSPLKRLEHKLSSSPERRGILPGALKKRDQYNRLVNSGLRQDSAADLKANAASVSNSTPLAEGPFNLGSPQRENRVHSTCPVIDMNANDSGNCGKSKGVGNKEFLHHNLQKESGNSGDYQTPLSHRIILTSQSGSSNMNFQRRTDPVKFKEKFSEKVSSYGSASPYVCKRTTTSTRLEKRLVDWVVQGPSRKEPHNLSGNDGIHRFAVKDPLSPTTIQCSNGHGHHDYHQGLHILQKPFSVQDVDNIGRKRRIEEAILTNKDNINEIGRIHKSPKVVLEMEGSVSEFRAEHFLVGNNETEKIGGYELPRHWADVFSKFWGTTKRLLLPSIDKLNSRELDNLEDMLGRLQKAKKYEKICAEIQSKRIQDHLGNLQQERVAEARWLQQRLVYEQAKLQLLRLKQERLVKNVQLLQSGIQKSQNLIFNSLQHIYVPDAKDAQNKESHFPSLSVDLDSKNEGAYNKVTTMRQELGALDQKVKNLTEYFRASCKIGGEPSHAETIVLVNDHLRKRTRFSFIRQDLQLWEVDDLESKNGHHDLVLNYCHFLFQRFTVKVGSVSSIVTLNKVNDVYVMKNFSNINACTAFAFVFNAEAAQKLGSSTSLALETQITSSLLGNLLDVVEEVHIACIELRNLIQTSFHSPCVGQLDLQLCFVDFKTGSKVTLTLDMTCLIRGVYPSEILLSKLQTQTSASQTLQLLSAEIIAAVGALKAGHSRIIRLCRCVSQVVQASSRKEFGGQLFSICHPCLHGSSV